MISKCFLYLQLAISYLNYLILFYWNQYILIHFLSADCCIKKVLLYKNEKMIQDITTKFKNKKRIDWNDIITYKAIRQVNNTDVMYLVVEYEYFGETGKMLLHEGENLNLPIYNGYTIETLKKYTDRIRLISAVLITKREEVDFEDDSIFELLMQFEGIRKNFHIDVKKYQFYIRDFMYYLVSNNKMGVDDIPNSKIIISDYKLNDFEFENQTILKFM